MENSVTISVLLETYGKLLTKKQYNLLDDYYNLDLSLSEIAENEHITRQAVRDNLKKGENKLFDYEEKLGIMKATIEKQNTIENVLSEITTINCNMSDKEIAQILEDVKQKLKILI